MNSPHPLHLRHVRHIHFIAIGGIGMSGIAEVLLHEGYTISGSDLSQSPVTDRLTALGAKVKIGHDPMNVTGADVVVVSSAVDESNVEVQAARALRLPVISRAEMLSELMRFREGIAIAGTHGKTTTTSLVASVLEEGGLDPTFVIGGRLNSARSNARLGLGRYLVAEADESDASFLKLHPQITIVTNIDNDHLDTYQQNMDILRDAFVQFINQVPFYGLAVLCLDDPGIRMILPKITRPIVTYGLHSPADITAYGIHATGTHMDAIVRRKAHPDMPIHLALSGEHNVLNSLAVIAVAIELGLSDEVICRSLAHFSGVGRRFEQIGRYQLSTGSALCIDDYGHHPKKLEVTIQSARASWPGQRVAMVFQPHRYTRTRDLFSEFVEVLKTVDELILLDIYSSGEGPIPGVTSEALYQSLIGRHHGRVSLVQDAAKVPEVLDAVLHPDDILLIQGAGSISALAKRWLEQNASRYSR